PIRESGDVAGSAACKLVGMTPELIHLNDLGPQSDLGRFQLLCFIGGFSFGDHLGSGTVFANRVKMRLHEQLGKFVADGKLVIGICNGFQTLTRLGMVPALDGDYFTQTVALAHNDSGVFRDDWCRLKADAQSPCVFTRGIDTVRLPLRHGEGKFVADDAVLDELEKRHLVALKYADANGNPATEFPELPNGSLRSIAGICDPTGRVFGLMPHPEAFLSPYNAPDWTRSGAQEEGDGVVFFRNAIEYIAKNL
ncbi:MAG: phosphoribosylformylglycinamidine synthase subunit PurQ, partial [Victivallaceae bacterium]|nr:phosphoribosylformylglycinamidine synthase subunit PurQ [Victivallaceae bacterium]